jgi:hypothetical protein
MAQETAKLTGNFKKLSFVFVVACPKPVHVRTAQILFQRTRDGTNKTLELIRGPNAVYFTEVSWYCPENARKPQLWLRILIKTESKYVEYFRINRSAFTSKPCLFCQQYITIALPLSWFRRRGKFLEFNFDVSKLTKCILLPLKMKIRERKQF